MWKRKFYACVAIFALVCALHALRCVTQNWKNFWVRCVALSKISRLVRCVAVRCLKFEKSACALRFHFAWIVCLCTTETSTRSLQNKIMISESVIHKHAMQSWQWHHRCQKRLTLCILPTDLDSGNTAILNNLASFPIWYVLKFELISHFSAFLTIQKCGLKRRQVHMDNRTLRTPYNKCGEKFTTIIWPVINGNDSPVDTAEIWLNR